MKSILIFCLMLLPLLSNAQEAYKGQYTNSELKLSLNLDLNNPMPIQDIEYEGDVCYGIFKGSLNGTWYFLRIEELIDMRAVVRAVSDSGIEAQTLELLFADDSVTIRQINSINIRGVKNGKYVKLPKKIILKKN